jgi:hypothetical protein
VVRYLDPFICRAVSRRREADMTLEETCAELQKELQKNYVWRKASGKGAATISSCVENMDV